MMATTFTALMESAEERGGVLSVAIPPDWMQGRTTYGGMTAALCLEGVLRAFPDLPPLRSAQISFIGPAGGEVSVAASLLRRGKSVTFANGDLSSGGVIAARGVFAFGAARQSQFDRSFMPRPAVAAPDECPVYIPPGFGPSFAQHYDTRLAKGARPASASAEHDHFIWVRHRDEGAASTVALLALADMPPPAVMPMMKEFAPISSMTWALNFLTEKPQTKDGWWLLQSRAENAAEGYSSQDMLVWNLGGDAVIAGRQSVAVFA